MKKFFYAIAACSLFVFASCSKSYDANNEDPAYGTKTVEYSIVADAPGYSASSTKADLGAVARVFWATGDIVYVYKTTDLSNLIGTLSGTVVEGSNDSKATFTGTLSGLNEGDELLFVYAATAPTQSDDGNLSISLADQSITNVGGKLRVPFVAFAKATYSSENVTIPSVDFTLASSYVNAIVKDSKLGSQAISLISIDNISNSVELSADGSISPSTTGTLTASYSGVSCTSGNAMIAFAVPASAQATTARNLTLTTTDSKSYLTNFSTSALTAGAFYSTAITSLKEKIAGIGKFTINSDKKQVSFAPGNLYCSRTSASSSDWTWHFYDKQHKYNSLSTGSSRTASNNDLEIDLFTWGYGTWSIQPTTTDKYTGTDDIQKSSNDWGKALESELGADWFTLNKSEWEYILNNRGETETPRFAKANVEGVKGLLLYPDEYSGTTSGDGINTQNTTSGDFPTSSISSETWSTMESAGCVFLPCAGYRDGSSVSSVGSYGYYWSSTPSGASNAYSMYFYSSSAGVRGSSRDYGRSVRLAREL